VQVVYTLLPLVPKPASFSTLLIFCDMSKLKCPVFPDLSLLNVHVQKPHLYQTRQILIMLLEPLLVRISILIFPCGSADMLMIIAFTDADDLSFQLIISLPHFHLLLFVLFIKCLRTQALLTHAFASFTVVSAGFPKIICFLFNIRKVYFISILAPGSL